MIGLDNIYVPYLEAMTIGLISSPFVLTFASWLMIKAFKLKKDNIPKLFWSNLITLVVGLAISYFLIIVFGVTSIGSPSFLVLAPILLIPISFYLIHIFMLKWLIDLNLKASFKVSILSLGIAAISIYVIIWLVIFIYMLIGSFY